MVYHRVFSSVGEAAVSAGQTAVAGQTATSTASEPLSLQKISSMPSSIRCLVSMLQSIHNGGNWTRTVSATLLHPPSEGILFDKVLTTALPDEWDAIKTALAAESPLDNPEGGAGGNPAGQAAASSTGGETPAAGQAAASSTGDGGEQSKEQLRQEATEQALAKATQILDFNPGLTTIVPSSWQEQALAQAIRGGPSLGDLGRMVAIFDPKADEEPRVHEGQNSWRRYPAVNVNRFTVFLDAIGQTMREKEDFLVVFEGRVSENRRNILDKLDAYKLNVRELMFVDNKLEHDTVCQPKLKCGGIGKTSESDGQALG
jgi:hypothetical protein